MRAHSAGASTPCPHRRRQWVCHHWFFSTAFSPLGCFSVPYVFLNYVEVKKEKISTETNWIWGRGLSFSGRCYTDNRPGLMQPNAGRSSLPFRNQPRGWRGREHTSSWSPGLTWCWKHPLLKTLEFSQHFPWRFWNPLPFSVNYIFFSLYSSRFHWEELCLAQSCPSFNIEYIF